MQVLCTMYVHLAACVAVGRLLLPYLLAGHVLSGLNGALSCKSDCPDTWSVQLMRLVSHVPEKGAIQAWCARPSFMYPAECNEIDALNVYQS